MYNNNRAIHALSVNIDSIFLKKTPIKTNGSVKFTLNISICGTTRTINSAKIAPPTTLFVTFTDTIMNARDMNNDFKNQ